MERKVSGFTVGMDFHGAGYLDTFLPVFLWKVLFQDFGVPQAFRFMCRAGFGGRRLAGPPARACAPLRSGDVIT
ncbi:MAG: hypothetical protein M1436_07555 [Acidobacteria bacterium]|nr:hypothetical protein [Acidobacteriota bacterium]